MGWKSDKSLATQNKKLIYLTEQHGNKGIYSHVSAAICVHPWEVIFPHIALICTDMLRFSVYPFYPWDTTSART